MGGIYNTLNSHLYNYAHNNPIKYTDPDGRLPQVAIGAIVGGIAGAVGGIVTGVVTGKSGKEIAASGAVSGAVFGAIASTGIGVGYLIAAGAATSAGGSVISDTISSGLNGGLQGVINQEWGKVFKNAAISGVVGAAAVPLTKGLERIFSHQIKGLNRSINNLFSNVAFEQYDKLSGAIDQNYACAVLKEFSDKAQAAGFVVTKEIMDTVGSIIQGFVDEATKAGVNGK